MPGQGEIANFQPFHLFFNKWFIALQSHVQIFLCDFAHAVLYDYLCV